MTAASSSGRFANRHENTRTMTRRQAAAAAAGPPSLHPQMPVGRNPPMPRLSTTIANSCSHSRAQPKQTALPPPVNHNQNKFKKPSTNPQAIAIKNQIRQRNAAGPSGIGSRNAPGPSGIGSKNVAGPSGIASKNSPGPSGIGSKNVPGPSGIGAKSRVEQLRQTSTRTEQLRQAQRRKEEMELRKIEVLKGTVVEVLDPRHDSDTFEGSFYCGFGGCCIRLHNNINYFYHMWAHLARVLPYDYNESGKYSTTGHSTAPKRSELDHWAQCPQCFAEFDAVHKKSVHYNVVHSLNRSCEKFKSLAVCNICEMTVNKASELVHLRQHITKKGMVEVPYACKKCKYRSSTRMQLFKHYAERHANTSQLMCPACTQSFNVPNNQKMKTVVVHDAYINHIMRHFNEKSTRCPRCAVKMLTGTPAEKDKYQRHVKSHYDEVRIPPRLKQVTKKFYRREYKKPGRAVYPRKSAHKCAFCPKPHIDSNNLNSRTFRRSCQNKNCNFTSTCKQEFMLHKVICARTQIRKNNGTYVPVVRPSVPSKAPPRTPRNIYQCEKCEKIIEPPVLGNPVIANHMISCGGAMKAIDQPKPILLRPEREQLEEKFETFVFGLHRMLNVPVPEVNEREKPRPLFRRKVKDPWDDVFYRAMRAPTKSPGLQESIQRINKIMALVDKRLEEKDRSKIDGTLKPKVEERSEKNMDANVVVKKEPDVEKTKDTNVEKKNGPAMAKKKDTVVVKKEVLDTEKKKDAIVEKKTDKEKPSTSKQSRESTSESLSNGSKVSSKKPSNAKNAAKMSEKTSEPKLIKKTTAAVPKVTRTEAFQSILQNVFATEKVYQEEQAKLKAKKAAAQPKPAKVGRTTRQSTRREKPAPTPTPTPNPVSRELFPQKTVSSRGRVIKKIVRSS
uniref:C2H2-type domain-containing protein n=1 Tax=Steinernema glaseri TaxID=37863 RepID=A0A1I7ZUC8_9BILA